MKKVNQSEPKVKVGWRRPEGRSGSIEGPRVCCQVTRHITVELTTRLEFIYCGDSGDMCTAFVSLQSGGDKGCVLPRARALGFPLLYAVCPALRLGRRPRYARVPLAQDTVLRHVRSEDGRRAQQARLIRARRELGQRRRKHNISSVTAAGTINRHSAVQEGRCNKMASHIIIT